MRSGLNVGWGGVKLEAGVSLGNADSRVDAKDICEVSQGLAPEVSPAGIVGSELGLETLPGNRRRLS